MTNQPSQNDIQKHIRGALLKTLLLPVLVLIFFSCASPWYASKVHASLRNEINASAKLSDAEKASRLAYFDKLDLETFCSEDPLEYPIGLERVHEGFEKAGISSTFTRLFWGFVFSVVLVSVLAMALMAIFILNAGAGKSSRQLIENYQLGWNIGMAAAITKLVLLIPLLAYGSFEFTVLLADQFFPKLLLVIIIGGLIALWTCLSVLLKKVPLEFAEPMSREVKPEEAPELWQVVRNAAERLETAPPDRIIIGMKLNFYVTELAVKSDSGRVQGRTLFLSYPLLKQLSEDEIVAIIGHELGHFRGDDTRMTRRFYPLKFKINQTMVALARAGYVGWPSLGLLSFFTLSFEKSIQKVSRTRELLADQVGASLTSPQVLACALVKLQVLNETFQRLLADPVASQNQNPMDIGWHTFIEEKIAPEDPFWSQLFNKKLPHPLDSHPSLQVRLEALGFDASHTDARAIALNESGSAFATWFAGREGLFTTLSKQAEALIGSGQTRAALLQADYATAAGKELLDRHFPEIQWPLKPSVAWVYIGVFGFLFLFSAGWVVFFVVVGMPWPAWAGTGVLALFSAAIVLHNWNYRTGALTLNASGLFHTANKQPFQFAEAKSMNLLKRNSDLTVIFHLKEPRRRSKAWWWPGSVNRVAFSLRGFKNRNQVEMAQTIRRYYIRQIQAIAGQP